MKKKLTKRQKRILVNVIKQAIDDGTFLYGLTDRELEADVNVADKLIDILIYDYELEEEWSK